MSALLDNYLLLGEQIESFCLARRKLTKAIDPNVIVFDPTSVLDPEIDNIRKESQRLVNKLKRKLAGDPDTEEGSLDGTNIFVLF